MSFLSRLFSSSSTVFVSAFVLRLVLLLYGVYQDSHSAFKYTDIDYYVFTDAARNLSRGQSPYDRATYRYTPLLAWVLLPTTWGGLWFHFGKALFAVSDIIAGWLILVVLQRKGLDDNRALKYASVWLLNPMVANISTRGSSEGLLCVLVMSLLWAFESKRIALAGVLLGTSVHFKIYPFIYGPSMLWALESSRASNPMTILDRLHHSLNRPRVTFLATSLATFTLFNIAMYILYGPDFIKHTFTYHFHRLDHRHNFSPYNTLLYLTSSNQNATTTSKPSFASLAFLPQIALSALLIPLAIAKSDIPTTMLAQTLAFVAFNKVATSQYFLWYLIFLPLYLPKSSLMQNPRLGLAALGLWVAGQGLWLQQGYQLEFLGRSTFVGLPGLWGSSVFFFGVNCWILGLVVGDVLNKKRTFKEESGSMKLVDDEKKRTERIPVMPVSDKARHKKTVTSIGK
jgi:GPI mannosyltransferase 1 subunit M